MTFKVSPEAIQKYIVRRQEDLQNLKESFNKLDFSTLRHIAHQIKGSAATFGFKELGEKAGMLEIHALEKNEIGIQESIEWIENWLQEKLPE